MTVVGNLLQELVSRALSSLEESGLNYAVVGGLALLMVGRDRSTRDLDIVVQLAPGQLKLLTETLRNHGFAHHERVDRHRLDQVTLYRFWLPVENLDLSLSLDVQEGHTPLHASLLERARSIPFATHQLRVATSEDLLLTKLLAFRPIDRADAIYLLQMESNLDLNYIQHWVDRLELGSRWEDIRTSQ